MHKQQIYFILIVALTACSNPGQHSNNEVGSAHNPVTVLPVSDVEWEKLNPARGDQSPQAGTLWGDRKGEVPTGFLAKFVDGFSSPPHIHNVTYRAVVINGLIHNDDPKAETMWMKPGSFWTQPAGEAHITSARGEACLALVEIDQGPYLVRSVEDAFEDGSRPVNIDASNVVWLNYERTNWVSKASGASISYLHESKTDSQLKSVFVKLPAKFSGTIETSGRTMHAVVIEGDVHYISPDSTRLEAGSYFGSTDHVKHRVKVGETSDVILYIRTNGSIRVN